MDEEHPLEISLSTLRVILFGDERLEETKVSSKGIGDTAKVLIRPVEIGQAIKEADQHEKYFHVEAITNPDGSHHCEIWLSFEWRESNARRSRQQAFAAEHRAAYDKETSRISAIHEKIKDFGLAKDPTYARHLAKSIYANWQSGNVHAVLKLLDLTETLSSFEEEDKQDKL